MNVNPAHAATPQVPMTNELDSFGVRHDARLMHTFIHCQKLFPPSAVTDEKLSVNQLVPNHFINGKEPIQLPRVGSPVRKESNPHRCIDQNH